MYLKSSVTHGNITSYQCPLKALKKKKGNTPNLTGQWCLSPWQPQEARRRSYFGVNVARFVGRRFGGDTTQGVTPPHPHLSLDLLSGTPCMEQGIVSVVVYPGLSMLPGGALSCPTSTPFCISAVHGIKQDIICHWMGVSTLHVMSFVLLFSRLHCSLFHPVIVPSNLLNSTFWAWIKEWSPYKLKGARPQGLTNLLGWHIVSSQNCAWFVQ